MKPEVQKIKEHYEIYLDGNFVCSCDTNELRETLADIYSKYNL